MENHVVFVIEEHDIALRTRQKFAQSAGTFGTGEAASKDYDSLRHMTPYES
jgi:hypothetical protein